MCRLNGRRFIVLFKLHSIRWLRKTSVKSLARQQSVFQQYRSEKHLSEFYPQDGGESQLGSKLRHCHLTYSDTVSKTLMQRNTTTKFSIKNLFQWTGVCCSCSTCMQVSQRQRKRWGWGRISESCTISSHNLRVCQANNASQVNNWDSCQSVKPLSQVVALDAYTNRMQDGHENATRFPQWP